MGVKFSQLPDLTGSVASDDKIALLDVSNNVLTKVPISHASSDTAFGAGDETHFGHVKLSDTYDRIVGAAADSVAASQAALKIVYDLASQPSTDVPLSVVNGEICVTYETT